MTQTPRNYSAQNAPSGSSSVLTSFQVESADSTINYSPNPPLPSSQEEIIQSHQLEIDPEFSTQKAPLKQKRSSWWFLSSLRTKATTLALAISTLPVLVVGSTAYFAANQGIEQQIFQSEQTDATNLEDKLNQFFLGRYADIQELASYKFLNNSRVRDIISAQNKEATLDIWVKSTQIYDSVAVYDLNGNVMSKTGQVPDHVLERDYFQAALKTNRPFISEPEISTATGELSVFVSAPIKDDVTGKTTSIVRTRIPMSVLTKLLGNQNVRQREFYLADSSGKIIASNKQEVLQKRLGQEFPQFSQTKGDQAITAIATHNQAESILTYIPDRKLGQDYNLNWSLLIARPTDVAFAPQKQLLLTILMGTAIVALLVMTLSTTIANQAVRPIIDAAKAVDKIGQGELSTRLEVRGEDELAALGSNINDMASQLEVLLLEQALAAEQALLLAKVTGSRTLNSQELDDLFQQTLEEARQVLKADRIIIYRFNRDEDGYVSAESVATGWPRALNDRIVDSLISQWFGSPTDIAVPSDNSVEAALHPEQTRLMERLRVKSSLEVPILHEGRPFGVLMAHYCSAPHNWQPAQINFLRQLAAQLGLCVDRVILLEQTEQLAKEQRQLKEGLQKRALELLMEVDPISKGDLTIRAKVTADEIGTIADSYNVTVGSLRRIVTRVQAAASEVAETTSSNEISVQQLSAEALRQAEEISTALDRVQEMAASARIVATSAEQAEAVVQQSTQTVEAGDAAMNRTVDGFLAIRETVAETAKKVKRLGESSQKISTVVSLISGFAAQSNLLALNASIEAARAGEEGRGFAVVADEVRVLAQQSAAATSEIEKLVASIQAETNEVVVAMEAGTEQVVTGTKLVDETRQSLNKITAASTQINTLVEAIAQATVMQSQAAEVATKTMTDVAAIANRTSTEASSVSSSFKQLRSVAQTLQEDVGQFKVS